MVDVSKMRVRAVSLAERLLRSWRKYMVQARSWLLGSHDVFVLQDELKTFLRTELKTLLGVRQAGGLHVEMPMQGARSLVWFVTCGGHRVVVRQYPLSQLAEAQAHRSALGLLASHEVSCPRLLHEQQRRRGCRSIFLVEEYVIGAVRRPVELSEGDVRAQAREIARLHCVTSDKWGKLGAECEGDFFEPLERRVERWVPTIAQSLVEEQNSSHQQISRWFLAWRSSFRKEMRLFSLTHGDLHPNNGLFTDDGRYVLLDFSKLEYGAPAKDVARYLNKVLHTHKELTKAFIAEYDRAASAEVRDVMHRFLPFYEAMYHLSVIMGEADEASQRESVARLFALIRPIDS